jgi:hypothetical protein
MHETEVTWGKAFLVWFHFIWRVLLYAILGSFVLGFVLTIVFQMIGMDMEAIKSINMTVGFFWGIAVNIWVIKKILNLRTKNFRVALIES